MKFTTILPYLSLACILCSCTGKDTIDNMKCAYLTDPVCIDNPNPHFSWNYTKDFVEAGSIVEIAETESGLGENTVLLPLRSYVWRVKSWNADSSIVLTSPIAHFETAMFSADDWKARWITDASDKERESAPMLRKEFRVKPALAKARLYMSAAAYAEVRINGEMASPSRLDPGYTAYDKRNLYAVYDIAPMLKDGSNCISAVLGNGFYNEIQPVAVWHFETAPWRGRARFLAEIHLTYKDGSKDVVLTDNTWKATSDGPYVHNNIYSGDAYDARKEIPGWDKAGFDDSAWENATEVSAPSGTLTAQKMPPVRPVQRLAPVDIKNWGDTVYVFDFGSNIAGVCELNVSGEAGTRVEISHAEIQKEDGTLENRNIVRHFIAVPGYDFQTDIYYLRGGTPETWSPSFTYHGFRYAQVKTDRPMKLDSSSLTALVMHTDVKSAGSFNCSNDLFNTIWDMARRTYLNNLYSIFTDCPHREKNGWTADNYLTTELALLNFDIAPYFINKWTCDVLDNIREDGRLSGIMPDWGWGYKDWIGPVWDASVFTIAETVYNYTGDLSAIRQLWPVYKRYLEYLKTRECSDGLPTYGIGDWVYLNVATPTEFTTPCFYYKDYCIMARFAQAMGEDPAPYMEKAQKIKDTINAKWFNPQTDLYANGSQAAQGIALYLGLAPEDHAQAIADNLARSIEDNGGFLEFGSMGSKTVPRMLVKYGHLQTAYDMAAKTDSPSWGGWIKKGMTTMCETWTLRDDWKDASLDHAFLGDIAAWYVNDIAGINPDPAVPGFRHIVIHPHFPEGLDWADACYDSVRGTIRSCWKRCANGLEMTVDIPFGTTATLVTDSGSRELKSGHNSFTL